MYTILKDAIWYTPSAYPCSCFELPNRKLVVLCRNSYAFQSFIFLRLSRHFPNQVLSVIVVSDYMYKLHALALTIDDRQLGQLWLSLCSGSCSTSSAGTECTKEVEEEGVCCCSEWLSAETGSCCACSCCFGVVQAQNLYAVSCKSTQTHKCCIKQFYCQLNYHRPWPPFAKEICNRWLFSRSSALRYMWSRLQSWPGLPGLRSL